MTNKEKLDQIKLICILHIGNKDSLISKINAVLKEK